MQSQLADMRVDYRRDELDVGDLAATWHEQLVRWLDDATAAGVVEPNAMVLATTDDDGTPSSRTVLCKGIDERGVVFYTNYTSAKSHDLRAPGGRAATFPWYALQRQVSLRGVVERVTPEETRAYWVTRPRGSQLGAWASAQSTPRRRPPGPRRRPRRDRAALRRRRRGPGATALGRLADRPRAGRVLAGPGEPDARPAAVRARPFDRSWRVRRLAPWSGSQRWATSEPGGRSGRVTTRDDDPTRPLPRSRRADPQALGRVRRPTRKLSAALRGALADTRPLQSPPTGGCGRPGSSRSSARSSRSSRCRRRSTSSPARRPTSA